MTTAAQRDILKRVVNVTAEKAARGVIFEVCRGNAPMLSRVNIDLEEGAEVKLVMLLEPSENGLVRHEVRAECGEGSHIHIMTIMIGGGDIYSDDHVTLSVTERGLTLTPLIWGKIHRL